MKTLFTLQQEAVDAILAARQNGKRAASYGFSFLNRNPRVLRGIHNRYERDAMKLANYDAGQLSQHWVDIKDMAALAEASEGSEL